MKKQVLLARVLTVVIAAGTVFSSQQAPLSVIAAEAGCVEEAANETADKQEDPAAVEEPSPELEAPEPVAEDKPLEDTDEAPVENHEGPAGEASDEATSDKDAVPEKDAEPGKENDKDSADDRPTAIGDTDISTGDSAMDDKVPKVADTEGPVEEVIEEAAEEVDSNNASYAGATYNDVFASLKGSGYSLSQARSSASTAYTVGQFVYVWGWLHDASNNLFKSYGSGTCDMTLAIYRPDGSCAYSYTYGNSDNNWIGCKVDRAGTWKIQSKISGALTGNNIQTITVKEVARTTYNDVFASLKGSGYSLSQARSSASTTFTVGQFVYVWGWLHDTNGSLYKSYGSGICKMTLAIYRPDGSCAYSYTYGNSDNNWIGCKVDRAGTWKIQCKISGALTGNNTQSITVKNAQVSTVYPTSVRIGNAPGTINVGDSRTLTAIVSPYNATNKGVTWSSSNTSVLTVNSGGKITAKKKGTVRITVKTKAKGKTAAITVKVNPYSSAKSVPNLSGLGMAEKMARTAESQIGYQGHNSEGTGQGDYTIYGTCVNAVGQQWCAALVSWISKTCGCKSIHRSAVCKTMADKSSNYRKWTSSNAARIKRGDVVFFSNSKAKLGSKGHVGIVTSISKVKSESKESKEEKLKITIVEGNTGSDRVSRNTYYATLSTGYIGSYWSYIGGYISVR